MSELIAGDIFDDKYEILKVLGAGGIGTVYQARQIDIERIVALKILHPHVVVDEEFKLRFLREAQALNKFSHSNIVTIYHLGQAATGAPYIVMEFIEGKSLRFVLSNTERMATIRALRVIREAARALEHVHKHGIVHRDLKPDNIILLDLPEADTVKIIDFGLARNEEEEAGNQKLTSTGALIGTVHYMSPEQCAGKRADHRSDIYSLALCLYEMLVGESVYTADTPMGIMYQHLNSPAPEIKAQNVERFSPELNVLLKKALAKDPDQRFQSMAEFAESISEAIDDLEENKQRKTVSSGLIVLSALLIVSLLAMSFVVLQSKRNESQAALNSTVGKGGKLRRYTENVIASEGYNGDRQKARQMCESTLSFPHSNYQRARILMLLAKLSNDFMNSACLMEAINLLGNEPKFRSEKLEAKLSLANSLRSEWMPMQALKCLASIMKDVDKNGLPEALNRGNDFDKGDLVQVYANAIVLNIEIGERVKALQLLEKSLTLLESNDENEPYGWLARAALRLKKKAFVERMIQTSNMILPLADMSVQCLRYQETALARACLDKAQKVDNRLDGHIYHRQIALDLAEARYFLATGQLKKARAIMSDQLDTLKQSRRNDRNTFASDTLILMNLTGVDTKEAKSIYGRSKTEKPKAAMAVAPGYDQILAAYEKYTRQEKTEGKPALVNTLQQALATKSFPAHQRCHLLLMLWNLEGENEDQLLIEAVNLLENDNDGRIGRSLRLRVLHEYGRLFDKLHLAKESQRIYETVYADLKKNGIPHGESVEVFDEFNRNRLVANLAKIYLDAGNIKALNLLVEDPAFISTAGESFPIAIEIGRKDLASKIIDKEPKMEKLRTLVAQAISRHDEELAMHGLNRCISLSKREADEKIRNFYQTQNEISKVGIDIEFAHSVRETAKDMEPLLTCDYSKLPPEHIELVRNQTALALYLIGAGKEGKKYLPGPRT